MADVIDLSVDLRAGPRKEVRPLLADPRRKLVLIVLREGELLADHSALHPITIHCVAGAGTLTVAGEPHALAPGKLVPVDAGVVHAVRAEPAVAVLVSFFRG